jgi:hypothetical protein
MTDRINTNDKSRIRLLAAILEQPEEVILARFLANQKPSA